MLIIVCMLSTMLMAQTNTPEQELAKAERAFSALCEKDGIKESFLQYLAEDCVMFNPHPVNGPELYKRRKASPTYLTWYPTFVEVAASGDFGISTGPWELRPSKNDTNVVYGHYFSVWKKQSNGEWKVIVDNGMDYPRSAKRTEREHFRSMKRKGSKITAAASEKNILEQERMFAAAVEKIGTVKAYEQFSSEDIRLYRKGYFPSMDKTGARDLIAADEKWKKVSTLSAQAASSGDLGFTYGYSVGAKNDSSTYIRVWRYDSGWKIAADLQEPISK